MHGFSQCAHPGRAGSHVVTSHLCCKQVASSLYKRHIIVFRKDNRTLECAFGEEYKSEPPILYVCIIVLVRDVAACAESRVDVDVFAAGQVVVISQPRSL